MCTLTWQRNDGGYDVFFNRDERKTRGAAEPPAVRESGHTEYIAPLDADAGGTWIAVNRHGLSLCLLNYYEGRIDGNKERYESRGSIILSLIDSHDTRTVLERFMRLDTSDYRPFSLVVISASSRPEMYRWTGAGDRIVERDLRPPVSSSSFNTRHAIESRRHTYSNLIEHEAAPDERLFEAYHRSHLPARGPYSVCVHRDDAETVSMSRVSVTDETVSFRYTPGSPCMTDYMEPETLPRYN